MNFKPPYRYAVIIAAYLILQAGYLIAEYYIADQEFGVPLDDVWIHFRFAENFAGGHFFQYNLNEPTPGTTSPLWVVLLSIPFFLSPGFIIPFSFFAGSLFFLLTCIEVYRLSLRLGFGEQYSFLITMITMLCGRLLWSSLSGMEITLVCYLSILVFKTHLGELSSGKLKWYTGLLLGLACVTRPEAYLLALVYYPVSIWFLRKGNAGTLAVSVMILAIIAAPYHWFSYVYSGSFLPNTFRGQGAGLRPYPDIDFLRETGKMFFRDNLFILFLWFAAMLYFAVSVFKRKAEKEFFLLNIWVILLPLAASFVAPNWRHHGRYLVPLIPFINIVSVDILRKVYPIILEKNLKLKNVFKKASIVLIILFSLNSAFLFAFVLGWNVQNINAQQVNIGKWLRENLPEEKAFGMNDIGAIAYFTRKEVVDMEGLVTPEIFEFRKMQLKEGNSRMLELLRSKKVNYIIIYPHWFEYLMQNYSDRLERVYSARLAKNTICGGIEMFVFRINWEKIE